MATMNRFALRAAFFVGFCLQLGTSANAQSIGDNMISYLNGTLATRVGGGECDQMATEALRVAGGEFVPSDLGDDFPSTGDKVWGTLVTVISNQNNTWSDSNPGNTCLPGDVIQFGSAVLGTTSYPQQFTCVVAAVDTSGRPTSIYQQNFNNNRVVQQATFDATQLNNGWLRIYRPIERIDRFNEWKFTIVNNDTRQHTYYLMYGEDTITVVTVTAANTAGSFYIHSVDTDGTVPNFLLYNETSYFVQVAKGNEIYQSPNGLAILQLSQ